MLCAYLNGFPHETERSTDDMNRLGFGLEEKPLLVFKTVICFLFLFLFNLRFVRVMT